MIISPASHEPDGLEKCWKLGAKVPEAIHDCIHNFLASTFARQSQVPAVWAWDGDLTYGELDKLASKLAAQLVNLSVGSGGIVPLYFKKSMWTTVAVLGVVKAGAGFVILDRFLPEERLQIIVQQAQSKWILASLSNCDLASRLSRNVIMVGSALAEQDGPLLSLSHPAPHPSSIVYVVFTSESTGVPKGCVVSHENLCSALHHQVDFLGFKPTSRVFDFASYSFDVTIQNLFATWLVGGCVCIPNDADRKDDLANAINRMQATLVNLTPTVARLLDPEEVPTLETLILLGEIVTEKDGKAWWGKTQLNNAYGPTECTSITTINYSASSPAKLGSIGVGKGAVTWIVDPQSHNLLLPWGQTGELLIKGPIVGLGYLNDPERTAASFIYNPPWIVRGAFGVPGRRATLYKTGDLARYDEDGNIIIIGRKDTQVKIRGNRVELGEVESRIQDCMPEVMQVIAEAILPTGSETGHILAAFLKIPGVAPTPTGIESASLEARLLNIDRDVEAELAKHLPTYMIPTMFFTMPKLPLTLTGKTNRKILREIGGSFSAEQMALQGAGNRRKETPGTDADRGLRDLWARVLNVASDSIGVNDSFFRLGGDSIAAMKLVGEARKVGIRLTVADIFRQPVLGQLTKFTSAGINGLIGETSETSLLDPDFRDSFVFDIESSNVALRAEDIAEILPLTDMQESFILEGESENRQFVDYYYLDLGLKVDVAKFKASCHILLEKFPILRASFIPCGGKHWTVIPKYLSLPFHTFDVDTDLEDALTDVCLRDIATFKRHQPIISFMLLRHKVKGGRLIVRLSHAQYDAIAIGVIFRTLVGAYHGREMPKLTDYSTYISHIVRQRPTLMSYWQKLLKGATYTDVGVHFLPKAVPDSVPVPFRIGKETPFPKIQPDTTTASFMSAAWVLFLSHLLKLDEVIYGCLVSGRNAALPDVEDIVGCCINVVPVRVALGPDTTAKDLINSIQEQFVALGEADSLGFREVVEESTNWPPGAGIYSCTMHQNVGEDLAFAIEGFTGRLRRLENDRRLPIFLYMISSPRGDMLGVQIYAHSHMIPLERAKVLLDSFLPVVERLAAGLDASLSVADVMKEVEMPDLEQN